MSGGRTVTLSWDGGEVTLGGGLPAASGLYVTREGIDGWDSAPEPKVGMTEMQTGDGAHAVRDSGVIYSARTVTVGLGVRGRSRDEVVSLLRSVSRACHRVVSLRVRDGSEDTFCRGYLQPVVGAEWDDEWADGTLTVVCPDPRRYSTELHATQLMPSGAASGGLSFGPGRLGLELPLSFGEGVGGLQNVATLHNAGTSPAYPVIAVTGPVDAGLRLDWDGGSLSYGDAVRGVPLTLDCLTRTASVGGLDTSRHLTSRGFPVVPAGGSVTISAQMAGSGWATVQWRDTYI